MQHRFGIEDYWRMLRARGAAYPIHYFLQCHWFDIRHRTDTHRRLDASRYDPPPTDFHRGIWYVCSPTDIVVEALHRVEALLKDRFADFQFVDLGCGKGKALLVYGLRFREVALHPAVGLEYHAPLSEIAAANISRLKLEDVCCVHCADARDFSAYVSAGRVIIFLYNPFDAGIIREVLQNLSQREIIVAYVDPAHGAVLKDLGYGLLWSTRGRYPNRCIDIYGSPLLATRLGEAP
jgi:hypothetical protein